MTRRDRCAMALALECLRGRGTALSCLDDALGALYRGDTAAMRLMDDVEQACRHGVESWAHVRARLALALRTLLRVEAGDYGPREPWLQCARCWRIERDLNSEAARQGVCVPYPRNGAPDCPGNSHAPACLLPMHWPPPPYRRVHPLWLSAPAHTGGDRG